MRILRLYLHQIYFNQKYNFSFFLQILTFKKHPRTVDEFMVDTKHSNNLMNILIDESEKIFGPRIVRKDENNEMVTRLLSEDEFNSIREQSESQSSVTGQFTTDHQESVTRKPIGKKQWKSGRTGTKNVRKLEEKIVESCYGKESDGDDYCKKEVKDDITFTTNDTSTPLTNSEESTAHNQYEDAQDNEEEEEATAHQMVVI